MKIAVISADRYLWQKIRLIRESDEVALLDSPDGGAFDAILFDLESAAGALPEGAVGMSRRDDCTLPIPFTAEALSSVLDVGSYDRLTLDRSTHTATLDGEAIKLTEVEFALLSRLYDALGKFVSRAELIYSVWNGNGSDGVINVYIHYLREKLERAGEKIIISSRKEGYRLSEKMYGRER